jgi:hypothetical protein
VVRDDLIRSSGGDGKPPPTRSQAGMALGARRHGRAINRLRTVPGRASYSRARGVAEAPASADERPELTSRRTSIDHGWPSNSIAALIAHLDPGGR